MKLFGFGVVSFSFWRVEIMFSQIFWIDSGFVLLVMCSGIPRDLYAAVPSISWGSPAHCTEFDTDFSLLISRVTSEKN